MKVFQTGLRFIAEPDLVKNDLRILQIDFSLLKQRQFFKQIVVHWFFPTEADHLSGVVVSSLGQARRRSV